MRRPRPTALLKLSLPVAAALCVGVAANFKSAAASVTTARAEPPARKTQPKVVPIKAARALPPGAAVTVEGVVTTPPGAFRSSTEDEGFAVEDASGAGLYVRTNLSTNLRVGRRVGVTGRLEESNGKLVLVPAGAGGIEERGHGGAVPRPREFSTREIGEATEGRLVRVAGVVTKAVQDDAPYGFRFFVDDGTGEVQVFVSASTKIPTAGLRPGRRVAVTGFSGQYKEHYEVEPRFAADISFRPQSIDQQEQRPRNAASCGDASKLLLNSKGTPVWLSVKEVKRRAIRRVAPEFPSSCRCQGTVVVQIFVNTEGKVECVWVPSGHPLLRRSSANAAKQWTFKALTEGGQPVAFVGLLAFTFESHGEVKF
jgi:uncharacterized protein YdeI (BOF family)